MRFQIFRIALLLGVFVLFLLPIDLEAQCAMCRASVENSISNGGQNHGAGLNKGILYLMLAPYVLITAIGYIWYKKSKQYTQEKRALASSIRHKLG